QEACRRLYGPVLLLGRPLSVYLGSSSTKSNAAFALYWGPGNKWNRGRKFDGSQTEARSVLFAVLDAVLRCASDRTLIIHTSSEYAIRSFCYWAGDNATRGWCCLHADILRETAARIYRRRAPMEFRWV
ncbi:hypothetical protein GGX14DRAFT_306566, partial [Mycena pura]